MDVSIEEEPAKWRAERKLPFKQILFGLQQLIENGIANHTQQLEDALRHLQMSQDSASVQTTRENVRRALTSLTQDLRQMEEMKDNVKDEDIRKFESAAEPSRRGLHEAIQKARTVVIADAVRDRSVPSARDDHHYDDDGDDYSKSAASNRPLEDLALQERLLVENDDELQSRARYLESLARDMQDLKEMMNILNGNIAEEGEAVKAIEHHVENAAISLSRGEILLAQARHLKTAALPIVGLTVGFAAGGPIGAVAGARIGLATSVIGGAIGYAGGKILHKMNNFTSFVPRLRAPIVDALPLTDEQIPAADRVQQR